MAEENKKAGTQLTPEQVLKDQVEGLQKMSKLQGEHLELANAEIQKLTKKLEESEKALKASEQRAENAEKKLKAAKSAPTGDVVYIDGKTWPIKGTVKAQFALDHVKKGYIEEDVSLIITDRRE